MQGLLPVIIGSAPEMAVQVCANDSPQPTRERELPQAASPTNLLLSRVVRLSCEERPTTLTTHQNVINLGGRQSHLIFRQVAAYEWARDSIADKQKKAKLDPEVLPAARAPPSVLESRARFPQTVVYSFSAV